ncbi:MAG: HlyD family efflux transporter periplasmic adaptor subunit [Oscillospiraceae bacterium]|nr:HlyD family efflux transporter periplasmic adaptor subunit [Oscillospiraceae bacterium]
MNKTVKRVVIGCAVAAGVTGAVWGGLVIYRNSQKKPVNVYAMSNFSMTEYWGDSAEAYGMVTTDQLQDVYISDTQQVQEIYVTEGQQVRVGDPILAYDTTLSDIDLEKADTELQKLQLKLETAQKELTKIQAMRPHSSVLITPETSGVEYHPAQTPQLLSGSGTEEDPFYYLWGEEDTFSLSYLSTLFPTAPAEPEETTASEETTDSAVDTDEAAQVDPSQSYVVFLVRENNALNAPILQSYGLHLDKSSGEVAFTFFEPTIPDELQNYESESEPYYQESGSDYTSAEIAKLRSDKEKEIRDLGVSIKLAQVSYDKLEDEVNDGVVRSKIDGTIKTVLDADTAYQQSTPVVEISGGGGYYVDVSMSELDLDTVTIGQTVTINSWESGVSCEGEIVEISEYPATDANAWSDGNTNVSYYPFKVFVNEDADLRENEYVNVTYQKQVDDGNSLYLENEFIRTDGSKSYVYVRNEDGLLEKRTVQTGRNLWGSYTQIRGGVTAEDYLAFPYGKDVTEGAKTVEAEPSDLYGY